MTNLPEGVTELCGRCLVVVNASTSVRARWKNAGGYHIAHAENLDVTSLIQWAEDMIYGQNADIEIGNTSQRMRPVSTFRGDLVCAYHLMELVSIELRMFRILAVSGILMPIDPGGNLGFACR